MDMEASFFVEDDVNDGVLLILTDRKRSGEEQQTETAAAVVDLPWS